MTKLFYHLAHKLTMFFYSLIVAADSQFNWIERTFAWIKIAFISILASSFIISLKSEFNIWFTDNQKFVNGFVLVLFANIIFGMWRHMKTKSFDWKQFFIKNILMMVLVSSVYLILHRLHLSSGDNMLSEGFEAFIQVLTLFYPTSKAIKSIYIISNGTYPPDFIMKKIYNFEKEGDLKDLFSNPKKQENNES